MLRVNQTLRTDTATTVALSGTSALKNGDRVILVQDLNNASTFTGVTQHTLGRYMYDITLDNYNLVLDNIGYISFREASDTLFGTAGTNNINIANRSDYLDRLNDVNDSFIDILADAYDAATIGTTSQAAVSLQQLFGGYAAYAGQAPDSAAASLSTTGTVAGNALRLAFLAIRDEEQSSASGSGYMSLASIPVPSCGCGAAMAAYKPGSLYYTDDWRAYASLAIHGDHAVVKKVKGKPKGKDHINGIEGFWSYANH